MADNMLAPTPSTSVNWPAPIEPVWQSLGTASAPLPGSQRPDLGLAERLFIGAVVNVPRGQRPWGIITWLGEMFQLSRPSVYAIGTRCRTALQETRSRMEVPQLPPAPQLTPAVPAIPLTRNRLLRTILTLLVPAGVPVGMVAY